MGIVILKPEAGEDLFGIWAYIAPDNPDVAQAFIDLINEKFSLLAENPLIGTESDELAPAIRAFPDERYIIFYRIINTGIEVIRVLHSARNINPNFF